MKTTMKNYFQKIISSYFINANHLYSQFYIVIFALDLFLRLEIKLRRI